MYIKRVTEKALQYRPIFFVLVYKHSRREKIKIKKNEEKMIMIQKSLKKIRNSRSKNTILLFQGLHHLLYLFTHCNYNRRRFSVHTVTLSNQCLAFVD